MTVGEKIREMRQSRGWKQEDLGRRAGMHYSTVSRIESGKQECLTNELTKFADVFGVDVNELLGRSNVEPVTGAFRKIPVLDLVHAGQWRGIQESRSEADIQEYTYIQEKDYSPHVFALKITGNSMRPMFAEGELVIIDGDAVPQSGEFGIVLNGPDENRQAMFRQIRWRGIDAQGKQSFEAVPLNPDYVTLCSNEVPMTICGKMIFHYRRG